MSDDIAQTAQRITTVTELKEWMRGPGRLLLPHAAHISGYGHIHAAGVGLDFVIMVDFPMEYLERLRNRAGGIDTPILRRWYAVREPVLFEADAPWPDIPAAWLQSFLEQGMKNLVAHGVYDAERCIGTFHCFYGIPGRLDASHAQAASQLVPILHETLCRVIDCHNSDETFAARFAALSPREREIARWVKMGKSNGEIARICGLSENTVKHNVTRIFAKVEVESRSQLIVRLTEHHTRVAPGYGAKIL